MPSLRQRLLKSVTESYHNAFSVHNEALRNKRGTVKQDGKAVTLENLQRDISFLSVTLLRLRESKTILFPVEQVAVFASLLKNKMIIPLEYKLPFKSVLLEFTEPIEVIGFEGAKSAVGFLLEQYDETEKGFKEAVERVKEVDRLIEFSDSDIKHIDWSKGGTVTINEMIVLYADGFSSNQISWNSNDPDGFDTGDYWDTDQLSAATRFKQLAIACIGYINCENIYLEKEGEVAKAINEKRERKGKSRLEPWYVCRIKGVSYRSDGAEKDTGNHQSIRYDVRGHFRRLDDGKTTWVRPHQRGLANELYVPKIYEVTKGKV